MLGVLYCKFCINIKLKKTLIVLSCVDRGEAQGRESEMEEHKVGFDMIKYTRSITAGVPPSSSKGSSME